MTEDAYREELQRPVEEPAPKPKRTPRSPEANARAAETNKRTAAIKMAANLAKSLGRAIEMEPGFWVHEDGSTERRQVPMPVDVIPTPQMVAEKMAAHQRFEPQPFGADGRDMGRPDPNVIRAHEEFLKTHQPQPTH
jgi:hypothetical protein